MFTHRENLGQVLVSSLKIKNEDFFFFFTIYLPTPSFLIIITVVSRQDDILNEFVTIFFN